MDYEKIDTSKMNHCQRQVVAQAKTIKAMREENEKLKFFIETEVIHSSNVHIDLRSKANRLLESVSTSSTVLKRGVNND